MPVTRSSDRNHSRIHRAIKPEDKSKMAYNGAISTQRRPELKPFFCSRCSISFKTESSLNRHWMPKIKCPKPTCNMKYRKDKTKDFEKHMNNVHPEIPQDKWKDYFESLCSVFVPMKNLCDPSSNGSTTSLQQSATSPISNGTLSSSTGSPATGSPRSFLPSEDLPGTHELSKDPIVLPDRASHADTINYISFQTSFPNSTYSYQYDPVPSIHQDRHQQNNAIMTNDSLVPNGYSPTEDATPLENINITSHELEALLSEFVQPENDCTPIGGTTLLEDISTAPQELEALFAEFLSSENY
ncbi:MAG: hypothetical protein M1834_005697 [Cirrosporium novae-zelandiae]|nr:MAG: hypothetical protein M1834_005697 [Cirrosporium novae-zelandiae]